MALIVWVILSMKNPRNLHCHYSALPTSHCLKRLRMQTFSLKMMTLHRQTGF